jgi:hypothetical protein
MVGLYVDGEKVGTLADAERLLPGLLARNARVELRDDAGTPVGSVQPVSSPPIVPWDPTITRADVERVEAEPGFTFEEVKTRLGWE